METKDQETVFEVLYKKYNNLLDPNGRSFCARVYRQNKENYDGRIKAIGFEGLSKVLDAGCGFGQWTLRLARYNNHITAIDTASDRLFFLQEMLNECDIQNVNLKWSEVSGIPFADSVFDAIFCYETIFYTVWPQTVQEFARVLKTNGKLYINAHDIGWLLHFWDNEPNKAINHFPRMRAADAFYNTSRLEQGKSPMDPKIFAVAKNEMIACLKKNGFEIIAVDRDGGINVTDYKGKIKENFPASYKGFENAYEVLARKL